MEVLHEVFQSNVYTKLSNEFHSKVLRILMSVDKQVTNNLRDAQIATRPSRTNGLWCCILLPAVLVSYSIIYQVSELYTLLAYISVGLLAYCFLFIIFMSVSCLVLTENIFGGCGAASLVATLLLYGIQGQGLIYSLVCSTIATYSFSALLKITLVKCPKTFTIGEAIVVAQSIVLFGIMIFSKIVFNMGDEQDDEMKFINAIIYSVLSSVGIIIIALWHLEDSQRNISSLLYIVFAVGTYAIIILHVQSGLTCMLNIMEILLHQQKVKLILLWLLLFVMAVVMALMRSRRKSKASTAMRKSFHVLASLVFITGISFDIRLITLAAAVGFGLLILIEAIRKSNIENISPILQGAFEVYSDEKDLGSFAMTPLYLYVGLACPLVLVPVHEGYEVELLSGVLSIGVGDTAASWFGSKYGRTKWKGVNKTVEGTVFNIVTQVIVTYALVMFEFIDVPNAALRVVFTATISGLVEAKTDQVDNLILPLVTMIAFQATSALNYL